MLKDLQNARDIEGNDIFRKCFNSVVADFKPDERVRSKSFKYEHHHVVDLHGNRFLACVKHKGGALLIESDATATKKSMVVVASLDMSIYAEVLAEGREQIKRHNKAKRKSA